jgi:hypothetical protein
MSGLKSDSSLLKVPIYVAGKSSEEVREEFGLDTVLRMASNESAIAQ